MPPISIHELSPKDDSEIIRVAERMRETLIAVSGQEKGTALYSLDTLAERVRWHLDSAHRKGKVFLAHDDHGNVIAQTLARVEKDENGEEYGRFSMVYVNPTHRRQGISSQLITTAENWLESLGMKKSFTTRVRKIST